MEEQDLRRGWGRGPCGAGQGWRHGWFGGRGQGRGQGRGWGWRSMLGMREPEPQDSQEQNRKLQDQVDDLRKRLAELERSKGGDKP